MCFKPYTLNHLNPSRKPCNRPIFMIRIETINAAGRQLAARIDSLVENLALATDPERDAIIFVGALGICVRRLQSMVADKYTDPAVVCVDTTGRYVIPVLSGHVGGANELARHLAAGLGAEAVITTQSDNLGLWALDTLHRDYGWTPIPLSREAMNAAIATFVGRRPVALVTEVRDAGTAYLERTCPDHVTHYDSYEAFTRADAPCELLILVSPRRRETPSVPTLQYCPSCLHLGVGCQKDAPLQAAPQILSAVVSAGYALQSVATVDTITLKRDEALMGELQRLLPQAELRIHTADELARIDVPNPSERVKEVTGCYGVAEASALAHDTRPVLLLEKQKGHVVESDHTYHYTYALSVDRAAAQRGHVEIVGAGPGDPDLVSVRGRRFLEQADLILYAGSLVPKALTFCAKPSALVRSSADMDLVEQFELMKTYYDRGGLVVRLHTGDPCIYGAIQEQMAYFDAHAMSYHITPGISSFQAAAAELRSQFTIPERRQSIILTRGEGRTPMPEGEKLHELAVHQATMCIFLSATLADQVQSELLAGGYPPETPLAVCYRLTWPDQHIWRGQLKDLARIVGDNHLTLTTLIVVGDAIDNREGLSRLYDGTFTHLYRKGKV